jgi:8-amino-7-oxononanoate synthase
MLLCRARFRRYRHLDFPMLGAMLHRSRAANKIVLTDSVFSMDGDIAPLAELAGLCSAHNAWLVIDDAHGFGVLGPQGRGAAAQFGLFDDNVVYMGTLGKAAGVSGAFVAGSAALIESLIQRARPYIYTTASPPALAHALLTSIDLIERETWRREQLSTLIARLRSVPALAPRLMPSCTAIQPLLVGETQAASRLSEVLLAQGILVPAIRPPTVPAGSARLRISLSAAHRAEDIDRLVAALLP